MNGGTNQAFYALSFGHDKNTVLGSPLRPEKQEGCARIENIKNRRFWALRAQITLIRSFFFHAKQITVPILKENFKSSNFEVGS